MSLGAIAQLVELLSLQHVRQLDRMNVEVAKVQSCSSGMPRHSRYSSEGVNCSIAELLHW